jgi:hypothetical protein
MGYSVRDAPPDDWLLPPSWPPGIGKPINRRYRMV